jgi:L-lactate dehydrogenase complex protein LldG
LADRFAAALEKAGGRAYYGDNIEQAARALARILSESHPRRVLWAGDGLVHRLVARSDPALSFVRLPPDGTTLRAFVDPNDAAVTCADFGIAETGTVVLAASAQQPRLLSALVSIHIAVLPLSRLVPTFGDLLPHIRRIIPVTSSITCITGPSRTGDIEQTITIGAHGPRQLHVILINDCSDVEPACPDDQP